MNLKDKRLAVCAEMVTGDFICDIGTDHGYLPAYLVTSGRCRGAYAADVNLKPLRSAEREFAAEGISDKIQTFLSDGLEKVPTEGVTDIVIAGMGGELIARILSCEKAEDKDISFILQPMTKAELLRDFLAGKGFEADMEKAVSDGRFNYVIMRCRYTGKPYTIDGKRRYIGLLDTSEPDAHAHAEMQAERLEKAAEGMKKSSPERSEELLEAAKAIRAVL